MPKYEITYAVEGKVRFVIEADNEDQAMEKCPYPDALNHEMASLVDLETIDSEIYQKS